MTRVPFVDLRAQHESLAPDLANAMLAVLERGDFILGEATARFESEFAAFIGTRHAIGVGTGLDAIALSLRTCGIGPGDEVITAANTFMATVLAIMAVGAQPVLADIDPATHTIDPRALAAAVTSRTRAVVPVHLYGRPVDLDGVLEVAGRHGLAVIEDAAQAHGARYKGRRAGSFGHAAAFSFYPSKNLGACGDGGMVVTNDDRIAAQVRLLRNYGQREKYDHAAAGTNSRLDALQAAALSVKLPLLDAWNAARRRHAEVYSSRLAGVAPAATPPDVEHVHHLYVIETSDRDSLKDWLRARQIDTGIHYPIPVHLQAAWQGRAHSGDFPATERAAGRILSLPMYAELTPGQIDCVTGAIEEFLSRHTP